MMKRGIFTVFIFLLFTGSAFAGVFTDNGNGTVSDSATGLMWQQSDDDIQRDWQSALDYCQALPLAGYNDWRLPNVKELESIVDESTYGPSIDTAKFSGAYSSCYWSSTTCAHNTNGAWVVEFEYGGGGFSNKKYSQYVRCVR